MKCQHSFQMLQHSLAWQSLCLFKVLHLLPPSGKNAVYTVHRDGDINILISRALGEWAEPSRVYICSPTHTALQYMSHTVTTPHKSVQYLGHISDFLTYVSRLSQNVSLNTEQRGCPLIWRLWATRADRGRDIPNQNLCA